MKAIGEITRCTEKEYLLGKTAGDMLGNTLMISKKISKFYKFIITLIYFSFEKQYLQIIL